MAPFGENAPLLFMNKDFLQFFTSDYSADNDLLDSRREEKSFSLFNDKDVHIPLDLCDRNQLFDPTPIDPTRVTVVEKVTGISQGLRDLSPQSHSILMPLLEQPLKLPKNKMTISGKKRTPDEVTSNSISLKTLCSSSEDEEMECDDDKFSSCSARNSKKQRISSSTGHAARWENRFQELYQYYLEHGTCNNLSDEDPKVSLPLIKWVRRQRYQYKLKCEGKHSTLTTVRQKKLEDLGFQWQVHKALWDQRFDDLLNFRSKFGHCNVPGKYHNQILAVWVQSQRRQYRLYIKDRPSHMTKERIEKLEDIGFEWDGRVVASRGTTEDFGSLLLNDCPTHFDSV